MQADRLLEFASALIADFKETGIANKLSSLAAALQNQVQNPANAAYQTAVAEGIRDIRQTLARSKTNSHPPIWKRMMLDASIGALFGGALLERFDKIISQNGMTPAQAQTEVSKLQKEVSEAEEYVTGLVDGLKWFEIEPSSLGAGQFEIDITIPRAAIDNELGQLGTEFSKINRIVGFFSELATGSRENAQIIGIGTSDPSVFLHSAPATAAAFAVALERIIALYAKVLEIRKMHRELSSAGLDEKALSGIKDHIERSIKEGLEEQANALSEKYLQGREAGRAEELKNEALIVLAQIAERVDEGFQFDVRGKAPPKGEDHADARALYLVVEANRPKLVAFEGVGGPVLKLGPPKPDELN